MTEDQGSADNQQASGDVESKSNDKVSHETYKRVLAEAKIAKEKVKSYEAQLKQAEEQKLREQNDWKSLAEQKEKSYLEAQSKLDELESTILDTVKINAFQRHLGGKLKDEAYFQFVDTKKIAINPETKKVDDDSVKEVVAEFVKRHSSLVEFKKGKMPNEAGRGSPLNGKAPEEMSSAELEAALKKIGRI